MSWLLDTNVLSELRKPVPDGGVERWFDDARGEDIYTSVLVLGEIRQGVERLRRKDTIRAQEIDRWLVGLVDLYQDRIIDIDRRIADKWGEINADTRLPVIDGLLAATALTKKLTLVTRNVRDVERTGVDLLNPFND